MLGSLEGQGCFMAWFELDFDEEPLLTLVESLALSRARQQNLLQYYVLLTVS